MTPSVPRTGLWSSGDAYERYMGRWSRAVAPVFVPWVGTPAGEDWIDVGCGTGALSSAILAHAGPRRVAGVDPSDALLDLARASIADARFACAIGSADALPFGDGEFGAAVSGLVLNFVPDAARAVLEMARVVHAGGRVALYVWDYAGHMQIMRRFFDAAIEIDPRARDFDDGVRAPVCRPGPLARLLASAGLGDVEVRAIDVPAAFASFDEYWAPFTGGTGSAPKYLASLGPDAQARLRDAVRRRIPTGPDGEILLAVRAWAARGRVPVGGG